MNSYAQPIAPRLRPALPVPLLDAPASEEARPSIDLKQIYLILRRNALLVAGTILLVLAIGIIVTMLTTPRYEASASIQIDQETARVLNSESQQSVAAYQDADRFLQTQTDVLRSQTMAGRVAQSLGLVGNPTFFGAMQKELPRPGGAMPRDQQMRDATIKLLTTNLGVSLPRDSRVVKLTFTSPDASLAARVANAYATGFIDYNLQRKYDSSAYARSFLAKQLAEAKTRLEASERALNTYARAAGLIRTGEPAVIAGKSAGGSSQSVTTASLVQLNEAANTARSTRIAAEQRWRGVANVSPLNITEVLANQAIQELVQQRAVKAADVRNELANHKGDYPTVLTAQAQVDELNRQITTLAAGIKASIRDAYRIALEQEQALDRQVSGLKSATLAEQDRGVRYNILAREADTNRTLYDGLLQRFKEVSAEAGITTNNVSLIDQAEPPQDPSSPRLLLNVALALLAGMALAGALVFAREQMDDAVRAPGDVERKLGLNVLGVIPRVGKDEAVVDLLAAPRTGVSEAYHALRTSLLYSSAEGLPRTMLITSSQSGEGKSTTSYAIAADLARLGLRVVLVDTDLRRPSLHRVTATSNANGLSSVLTRRSDLNAALLDLDTPDGAKLTFLPAGPIPPSPTELLGSIGMSEVIARLAGDYEAVVLDGPPVLGLADAPILSAQAEVTLFVLESNRGRRGATKSAIRRLQSAHGRLLGVVLTKFDARRAGMSEYYGYEYYYYGQDEDDKRRVEA